MNRANTERRYVTNKEVTRLPVKFKVRFGVVSPGPERVSSPGRERLSKASEASPNSSAYVGCKDKAVSPFASKRSVSPQLGITGICRSHRAASREGLKKLNAAFKAPRINVTKENANVQEFLGGVRGNEYDVEKNTKITQESIDDLKSNLVKSKEYLRTAVKYLLLYKNDTREFIDDIKKLPDTHSNQGAHRLRELFENVKRLGKGFEAVDGFIDSLAANSEYAGILFPNKQSACTARSSPLKRQGETQFYPSAEPSILPNDNPQSTSRSKLAQILVYVSKRRVCEAQQKDVIRKLRTEISGLKEDKKSKSSQSKEIESNYEKERKRSKDYLNRYNTLMKKFINSGKENTKLHLENAELKRKVKELETNKELECMKMTAEFNALKEEHSSCLKEIKEKDENMKESSKEVRSSKNEIKRLLSEIQNYKAEVGKLVEEVQSKQNTIKELLGAIQSSEATVKASGKETKRAEAANRKKASTDEIEALKSLVKQIETEKQGEIIFLRNKILRLESELSTASSNYQETLNKYSLLRKERDELKKELDKQSSASTADGFKALMTLANVVLARSSGTQAITSKEKKLIREIFDENTQEMLEEIVKQQNEVKRYKDALRRLISKQKAFLEVLVPAPVTHGT